MSLVNEVRTLMRRGEYDPENLFKILYSRHSVHYSKIREAVHEAKTL